ncbi:MAG: hypothetical protein WCH62_04335, partial [Candidatus Omnitrophota bacterium]
MMRKRSYILEIVLVFVILDVLNFCFLKNNMGFLSLRLHPYWLIVLFIPTRYGFASGFIAGAIAAIHVIVFTFGHFPSRIDIEKIGETNGLDLPIAFVIVGLFLGAVRQQYIDSEEQKTHDLEAARKLLKDIQNTAQASETARRLLESRIVGETTTVKTLYEAAKRFENLDLQSIYKGCLNILAEHLKVEKASAYLKEEGYLVLQSSYGWPQGKAASGKILFEDSIMNIVFEEKEIVTVKDVLQKRNAQRYQAQYGEVLAMIPIFNRNNEVI